jgi:hypothetical protein
MPRLTRRSRMGRGRRRMRMKGGSVVSWLRKAHDFVKKNKLVSRVAGALASGGVPYAKTVGSLASKIGYGRKMKRGGSLRLAGGALRMRY